MIPTVSLLSRAAALLVETVTPRPVPALTAPAREAAGDTPLALDSVYRAVSVITTAVTQLSLDVWRDGSVLDPAPSVVRHPCRSLPSRSAFLAVTTMHLALRGEAFWLLTRDQAGTVVDVDVVHPLYVGLSTTDTTSTRGRVRYTWAGRTYTSQEMTHLALLRGADPAGHGTGPVQACMTTVTGALRLRRWADQWLDQGRVPPGILTTDQPLTDQDAEAIKTRVSAALAGGYTGDPLVLGNGAHYAATILKPEEMQWIEAQKANTLAVARMFGIPARHMLTAPDGSSMTYANAEQEDTAFVRYTLMAYLREIEEAVTALLPRGQTARFNVEGIQRADTRTRYAAHATALGAGFLTVNEVRAIEGLPPLTTKETPA